MLTGPGHLCLLCIDNLTQSSAFTFQSPAHGLRSSPESQMHGNSLLSISTGSLIEVSNLACSKCSSCFKPTTPVPFPVFLTSLSNSSIYPVASTQKPSSQIWFLSFSYLSHSVQFSSVAQSCPTLCDPMDCSTPGLPVHHQLLEFAQTQVHWVGDTIQPSHPLSAPSLPAFNPSQHQGLFEWVSSSHQVAKVLEFQLQHQSSNEYSGLIWFRMDWLDLLAVQGTLKSLLQHHSSKASILRRSGFFIVSHIHTWLLEKPQLWLDGPLLAK